MASYQGGALRSHGRTLELDAYEAGRRKAMVYRECLWKDMVSYQGGALRSRYLPPS